MNAVVESEGAMTPVETQTAMTSGAAESMPQATPGVAPLVALLASGQLAAEHVEQALALQKQHDEYEAKKAFSVAMVQFRRTVGTAKRSGNNTHLQSAYSTLDDVVAAVSRPLSDAGLSFRFEVGQDEYKSVTVSCVIEHELGHSTRDTRTIPIEVANGVSLAQRIGIAEMYGKRRTLASVTGVASGDEDTDANPVAATIALIDDRQQSTLVDLLDAIEALSDGYTARWKAHYIKRWRETDTPFGIAAPASEFETLRAELEAGLKKRQEAQASAEGPEADS